MFKIFHPLSHTMACTIAALIFAALLPTANAEVTWTKDEGLQAEGGILGKFFGEGKTARNAIELMQRGREALAQGKEGDALDYFNRTAKRYNKSYLAPEALYEAALIYQARNQFAEAQERLERIIERYPDYPAYQAVIDLQFELGKQLMQGQRPHYWGIIPGFKNKDGAAEYFQNVLESAPFSEAAPEALLNIATLANKSNDHETAIDALEHLLTNYPASPLAPEAHLTLAQTYSELVSGPQYDQGSTIEALSTFEDFLLLYPENENTEAVQKAKAGIEKMRETFVKSKIEMADFYFNKRGKVKAATRLLNEAIAAAPETKAAAKASKMLAKIEAGANPKRTKADWILGPVQADR